MSLELKSSFPAAGATVFVLLRPVLTLDEWGWLHQVWPPAQTPVTNHTYVDYLCSEKGMRKRAEKAHPLFIRDTRVTTLLCEPPKEH